MAVSRNNEWAASTQAYTADQVEAVLKECGIDIRDETENDFISYCPYHGNRDTPAFSTSKTMGVSLCFNPACAIGVDDRLDLDKLVRDTMKVNHFEAKRIIMGKKSAHSMSLADRVASALTNPPMFTQFDPEILDVCHGRLWDNPAALDYLHGRGFTDGTLERFKVGFSPASEYPIKKPDLVVVPMYDPKGMPVGLIGRSIVGKEFKNSPKLPKSKTIWNLHDARKYETLIINEASFDSMRVYQSGYKNVGALLGGSFSIDQEAYIKRYFTKVIIMTDFDKVIYYEFCRKCVKAGLGYCQGHQPGRDLGMKIAERLAGSVRVHWAAYDDTCVYPHNAKDASDMTDDEIRQCLRNAVSHQEYLEWMVA